MSIIIDSPPKVDTKVPEVISTILRAEVLVPVLVILGFASLIMTGFGVGFGQAQPLPLYIFLSILLLVLQLSLIRYRSILRSLYGIAAALFGLVFAAEASFFPNAPGNFTQSPVTYIVVNIAAVIVFGIDAFQRHSSTSPLQSAQRPLRVYRVLATDFAGLALLFGIASFLLDFIHTRSALRFLGVASPHNFIAVDLNSVFGFALPDTVRYLEGFDLALAFIMAAIWLLLIVLIGALTQVNAENKNNDSSQTAATSLLTSLMDIVSRGLTEATYSLRSVLQIFLWLIPAFSIANFAISATAFFNVSAAAQVGILTLFNPFSASSLNNFQLGLLDILFGILALIAVVVTVAVAEFDRTVITQTLDNITEFTQIVSLTLIFFTLSLAVTNAAINLFGITKSTPFQVGAATTVSLLLFLANILLSQVLKRFRTSMQVKAIG
jgi:hypothetical protein